MLKTEAKGVSVIIPVYNEEGTLAELYAELTSTMVSLQQPYEIIFINDGSSDRSPAILDKISQGDSAVTVIHFDKNYGQTSAFDAGIRHASGEYIVSIDADLQLKPRELVKLCEELRSYDAVIVRRKNRIQADGIIKAISSRIANYTRNFFLGEHFNDVGCFMRGLTRQAAKQLVLYRNFQIFTPSLLHMAGCSIKEIEAEVHPRRYGQSKYNISNRLWPGLSVMMIIRWMKKNKLRYKIANITNNKEK